MTRRAKRPSRQWMNTYGSTTTESRWSIRKHQKKKGRKTTRTLTSCDRKHIHTSIMYHAAGTCLGSVRTAQNINRSQTPVATFTTQQTALQVPSAERGVLLNCWKHTATALLLSAAVQHNPRYYCCIVHEFSSYVHNILVRDILLPAAEVRDVENNNNNNVERGIR